MPVATTVPPIHQRLDGPGIDALVRNLGVPPRPQSLADIATEMSAERPEPMRIARIVASDVALTAAVLKVANATIGGPSRRVQTLGQAAQSLGLKPMVAMVAGLVRRKALPIDGAQLTRFWDVSAKRAWALSTMARQMRDVDVDVAQTFGLLCDAGIPLLLRRFEGYGRTLAAANAEPVRSFTEVEDAIHDADHGVVGGLMARSWGVSTTVSAAIRLHHDYSVFQDPNVPEAVARLIALGLVAERAIQTYAGLNSSTEWNKGGDAALGVLLMSDGDVDEWIERLAEGFSQGAA